MGEECGFGSVCLQLSTIFCYGVHPFSEGLSLPVSSVLHPGDGSSCTFCPNFSPEVSSCLEKNLSSPASAVQGYKSWANKHRTPAPVFSLCAVCLSSCGNINNPSFSTESLCHLVTMWRTQTPSVAILTPAQPRHLVHTHQPAIHSTLTAPSVRLDEEYSPPSLRSHTDYKNSKPKYQTYI